jgi:type VI protein secretion system component Hcp
MLRLGLAGRLVALCGVVAFPCAQAVAATAAMMTIGEPSQGKVKGSKQNKNAAPSTEIELLSVGRPGSDAAATGASATKRGSPGAADTLIVTKFYDANSAQLEQAAATNEVLHQVTIVFETAADRNLGASNGKVKGSANKNAASGAAASNSKTAQVLILKNVQVDEVEQTKNIQKIILEYQSIEVTYTSGKPAAAADDWDTP